MCLHILQYIITSGSSPGQHKPAESTSRCHSKLVLCRSMWTPGQEYAEQPTLFSTVTVLSHLFPHGLSSPYFQHCWGRWHPWDKAACLTPLSHRGRGFHGWVVSVHSSANTRHQSWPEHPAQTLGPPGVLQCSLILSMREMKSISKGHTNHINGFTSLLRPTHKHSWSAWRCSGAGPDQMAGRGCKGWSSH